MKDRYPGQSRVEQIRKWVRDHYRVTEVSMMDVSLSPIPREVLASNALDTLLHIIRALTACPDCEGTGATDEADYHHPPTPAILCQSCEGTGVVDPREAHMRARGLDRRLAALMLLVPRPDDECSYKEPCRVCELLGRGGR